MKTGWYESKEVALTIVALLGLAYAFMQNRTTVFNDWPLLIAAAAVAGILTAWKWPKRAGALYGGRLSTTFLGWVTNSIWALGLFSASVFAVNDRFSKSEIAREKNCRIIKKGSMIGKNRSERQNRRPVVDIEIGGKVMSLVLSYDQTAAAEQADSIRVTIRQGALGYDMIDNVYLANQQ